MTTLRFWLRRLRFALLATAATLVILLGVLAGLTQLAMPWLTQHPQRVERWLSDRLGRQVSIGRLDGRWVGGGPLLSLDDVRIAGAKPDQPALTIPHAELAFDLLAAVQRNRAFSEFRLADVELRLVHEDGEWKARDLDLGASTKSDEPFSMGALGAVEISRLKLDIDDAERNLHLQLVAPVLRVLNHGAVMRVLGRVRAAGSDLPPLELVGDLDLATRSGELYVGGRDVDLARLTDGQSLAGLRVLGGHGIAQLWMRLSQGKVEDVRARLALGELQLATSAQVSVKDGVAVEPRTALDKLSLVARWVRESDGWTLDIADLVAGGDNPPARISIERRGDDEHPRWRSAVRAAALEPLGNLAMLAGETPPALRRWLYLAHPRGTLEQADFAWNAADDYTVGATLRGIELASADTVPGVTQLDLDLTGDADALLLQLPLKALRIDYPRVFRKPFLFAQFGGDIVARRVDDVWRLETERVGFEGVGYGGEVRGSVDIASGRKPSVDLYALVTHADVVAAKLFWPTTSMSAKAIDWLDRALVNGRLVEGRVAIHGDLVDWPFHDHSGYFIARGEIADMTLDYNSNWPPAEHVHAIANFINDGVHLEADAVESMGNKFSEATATIEDFGPLILDLSVKGEGTGPNLLAFLRATPIGKRYQEQIKDLAIGGKGTLAFALNLPIKDIETLRLDGSVDLSGARLDHSGYDLHFTDATGTLRFNQKGFLADQLEVGFRERKAKLSVAVGGHVVDPHHVFEATLGGTWPVTVVFADVPVLLPLFSRVKGESEWTARVAVDHADNGNARSALALDSTLVGTAIDLPAPLAKAANATLPFHLDLDLPYAGHGFGVRLGDVVGLSGRVPGAGQTFAARVEFGSAAIPNPPAAGIVVGGRMAQLDAGAWLDLAESGGDDAGSLVHSIDVRADDLLLGGRHFDDMGVAITNAADATTIKLDGAAIAGTLEIPRVDLVTRGITATFARMHLPETPADAPDTSALSDVAPGSLPPLHVSVEDFQLGKASFGSAKFATHPIANGMQIDTLESHSPNVNMTASGDWTGGTLENHSRMSIQLSAQSLGRMMDALGFPGLIDGGGTKATIDASWLGAPSSFALAKLDGTLAIDVAEGRILDVEPGAGRIFGLLSLTEIPRRLSLDFSDFFQSGLGFNSIIGTFRLAGGNAYTDGLKINSPAAEIVVSGRTGLRAKDYDQMMDVRPHAGATLPIVGALAAGPVGAAAGFVMQGIFNKPIGKAIARRYKVSGSWDKPQITQLARMKLSGRQPASAPPPEETGKEAAQFPPDSAPEPPVPWDVLPGGPDGGLH